MLTPEEEEVLRHLEAALELFYELPVLVAEERGEFFRAFHAAQNMVMARPVLRSFAQASAEGGAILRQIAIELRERASSGLR